MAKNAELRGKTVAVPENRQLGVLVALLRNRGAEVLEVPLVSILDAPDPQPVLAWLRRFIERAPDYFVLLTGEGLTRLLDLAARHELDADFVQALTTTRKVCRGPKPERVLKTLGLKADVPALAPTTEGVIASLEAHALAHKRVAVQLYGEEPNLRLTGWLAGRGAVVDAVAPYVYAGAEDEAKVLAFIQALHRAEVDAVTFTSQPQYKRLLDVARSHGVEEVLHEGLQRTMIAAVGPLVAAQLQSAGLTVSAMPERMYFMKPLVSAIMRHFEQAPNQTL